MLLTIRDQYTMQADVDEGANMPVDTLDFKLKYILPGFKYNN